MDSKSLSAKAYQDIKNMLITLNYPPGSLLKEQQVADLLGVSRTPVREALQRLAHEGWLRLGDRKRVSVSLVTKEDIEELYQMRALLEPYAAGELIRRNRGRIVAAQLDGILNRIQEKCENYNEFARLDMVFHSVIIKSAENERMNRFWLALNEENLRAVNMSIEAGRAKRTTDAVAEHTKLVDSFWKKDEKKIQAAICMHLEESKNAILDNLSLPERRETQESERAPSVYPLAKEKVAVPVEDLNVDRAVRGGA